MHLSVGPKRNPPIGGPGGPTDYALDVSEPKEATGVALMREHEIACERETRENEPVIAAVLQDAVDCIVESAHAFEGLDDLEDDEQAILTQIVLGARSARVFVELTLTGQYESALAVARTLIEDGIACAYLVEHPDHAARWRRREIELKYGDMAKAVIEAHAKRDEEKTPGEGEAWRRGGEVLRHIRKILDDLSHANPARIAFVLTERGYELYPFFDRGSLRATTWTGLLGLFQMLFFTRMRLGHYGKPIPSCNSDALRDRMVALLEQLQESAANPTASNESTTKGA